FPVAPALVASLALYTLIVSLWPYVPDRFMWILTPIVALFLACAIRAGWKRVRVAQVAASLIVILLVAGFARRQVVSLTGRVFTHTAQDASVPVGWLAA